MNQERRFRCLYDAVLQKFYRTQVSLVRSMCLVLSKLRCVNLTDVTLADEDTESILTDNTNRANQGNM